MASKKIAPPPLPPGGSMSAPSVGKSAWDGLPGSLGPPPRLPEPSSIVPTSAESSLQVLEASEQELETVHLPDPIQRSPIAISKDHSEPNPEISAVEVPSTDLQSSEVREGCGPDLLAGNVQDAEYHQRTKDVLTDHLRQALETLADQHENTLQILGERYGLESTGRRLDMVGVSKSNGSKAGLPPLKTRAASLRFMGGPSTEVSDDMQARPSQLIIPSLKEQRTTMSRTSQDTNRQKHTLLDVWNSDQEPSGPRKSGYSKKNSTSTEGGMQSRVELQDASIHKITDDDIQTGMVLTSGSCLQRFVIHPYNPCRASWDMGSLVLVIYDMVMIPLGFFEIPVTPGLVVMQWITRLYWSFDMPMSFLTGFITVEGNIDLRPKSISRRYLRTWFGLDVLVVGVDWLELLAAAAAESLGFARFTKASRIFRILRMIRLLRLARMTEVLALVAERVDSERLVIAIDIFKLLILMLGVGHFVACLWYAIGIGSESDFNWLDQTGYGERDFVSKYLMSMRWAMSQFSGGMDEVTPYSVSENLFAIFVFLVTFWSGAVFVSILTSSMTQWYVMGSTVQTQLTTLRRYLSQNGISKKLALRVQRNAQHSLAEQQRTMPEESVSLINQVSEPLRVELHFEMFSPILSIHPFFNRYMEECPHVVRKVCHHGMKRDDTSPGDIIFSAGEIPARPKMYLVGDGHLEYKAFNDANSSVQGGEWVSEACLWVKWIHRGTLRALEDTRLYTVDSKEFQSIVGQFEHIGGFEPRTYAWYFLRCLNETDDTTDLHTDFEWGEGDEDKITCVAADARRKTQQLQVLKKDNGKSKNSGGTQFFKPQSVEPESLS